MLVKILQYGIIAYLLAIAFHSLFFPDTQIFIASGILFIIAILMSLISRKIVIIAGALCSIGIGLFHYSMVIDNSAKTVLDIFVANKEPIVLQGKIDSYPIKNSSYTSFNLDPDAIIIRDTEIPASTKIQIKTDSYTDYEYGMQIQTQGALQKPESFVTDNNRIFNYDRFLEKDSIYYILPFAQTKIIDDGKPSFVRYLYSFKQGFLDAMYRIIPAPESGLLAGILFGEKEALGQDLEDKFRIVGLMHIVVLSGYNVSIIINVIMRFLIFLPKNMRAILAVLSIISFALLVGAGPTVIRASIMAVFIVLANILSRNYVIERGLFIAGALMVMMNPKILIFDISFQLSFLATYGLIVFSPWLEEKFKLLPKYFAVRESAVATIAAQIMVAPLIIYTIGEFSLISPIVNVLVLFAVPYAMGFGFLVAAIYQIIPIFSGPFSIITNYLLEYQIWIVELFSRIPYSHIQIPNFHISFMLLAYVGIWYWIKKIK